MALDFFIVFVFVKMLTLSQITVLSAIVCISYITAAPVDVNNDTRPIVGAVAPEDQKVNFVIFFFLEIDKSNW